MTPSLTGGAFWMPEHIRAASARTVAATAVPGTWAIGLPGGATTSFVGCGPMCREEPLGRVRRGSDRDWPGRMRAGTGLPFGRYLDMTCTSLTFPYEMRFEEAELCCPRGQLFHPYLQGQHVLLGGAIPSRSKRKA